MGCLGWVVNVVVGREEKRRGEERKGEERVGGLGVVVLYSRNCL